MRKHVLLLLPDNIEKPFGGVGTVFKAIIAATSDKYFYHIIGFNHNLIADTKVVSANYSYYCFYNISQLAKSSPVIQLISSFISAIDAIICVDPYHLELGHYVANTYKKPIAYCMHSPATSYMSAEFFMGDTALFINSCSDYPALYSYYHVPKERVVIIHNGVDTPDSNSLAKIALPGKYTNKLLFIGRITCQEKNLLSLLLAKLPIDTDLIVMGHDSMGVLRTEDNVYSMYLNKMKNVHYIGYTSGINKYNYINSVDAVIVPSLEEPFGLVCLEALQCQTPLITSFVPGLNSWLPKEYAIACGTTSDSIEQALKNFCYNKQIPDVCKAKEFADTFTVKRMTDAYYKLFTENI